MAIFLNACLHFASEYYGKKLRYCPKYKLEKNNLESTASDFSFTKKAEVHDICACQRNDCG